METREAPKCRYCADSAMEALGQRESEKGEVLHSPPALRTVFFYCCPVCASESPHKETLEDARKAAISAKGGEEIA